jgi:glycosyltransferase involved in cell wall biosynthesis
MTVDPSGAPRPAPRILQLIDHLGAGGAQEIVVELLRGDYGHRVEFEVASLFPGEECVARVEAAGARVHRLQSGLPYRPWAVPDPRLTARLARLLRAGRFDAVHVHLYAAPLHLRAACAFSGKAPRIFNTIHAQRIHLPPYVFPSIRLLHRATDFFVAECLSSIEDLRRVGVPKDRIAYIPIGIRALSDSPRDHVAAWRESHRIPEDARLLVSVARLHSQRHIDRMIRGFASFVSRDPSTKAMFVIVGDGEQRAELEALVARLGVGGRVRFTGHSDKLSVVLSSAAIYSGLEIQGDLSIAPLQAISLGIPCVALDFEARRRVTEAGLSDRNLCLVEPDEAGFGAALQRVFGSEELRQLLARHGRRVVLEQRGIEAMVEGYRLLYAAGHPGLNTVDEHLKQVGLR